jgi:hypothetical protein
MVVRSLTDIKNNFVRSYPEKRPEELVANDDEEAIRAPPQSTHIYRVPSVCPLVGIGTLPPPLLTERLPLPPGTKGRGNTCLRVRSWGVPIQTTKEKA